MPTVERRGLGGDRLAARGVPGCARPGCVEASRTGIARGRAARPPPGARHGPHGGGLRRARGGARATSRRAVVRGVRRRLRGRRRRARARGSPRRCRRRHCGVRRLRRLAARASYAPAAVEEDAVGRDRYVTLARVHCGADIDPRGDLRLGLGRPRAHHAPDERLRVAPLRRRDAGRGAGAARRRPGAHHRGCRGGTRLAAAGHRRDDRVLRRHATSTSPTRCAAARRCSRRPVAAPRRTTPRPSEDFSRPGRTWLPVFGQRSFRKWWLLSVWYHEAVPGHHLQVGLLEAPARAALALPAGGVRLRPRRGLGAVRRATHGRARLLRRRPRSSWATCRTRRCARPEW